MLPPRSFADFRQALTVAYEEEVAGAAYFATLAAGVPPADRALLDRFAQMERAMADALVPLLDRHGITPRAADDLAAEGRAEAALLAGQSWDSLATGIRDGYDSYVAEFAALGAVADSADRPVLDALVAHEVAMIAAARLALAGDSAPDAPVQAFLDGLARLAG